MRAPRRPRLSAPFVITVAAMAGCATEPQPPHRNPPAPEPEPTPPRVILNPPPPHLTVNPPPPPPPAPNLPDATDPARVLKQPDGSCVETYNVQCPPGVMCNPPPPHPVRCPPVDDRPHPPGSPGKPGSAPKPPGE